MTTFFVLLTSRSRFAYTSPGSWHWRSAMSPMVDTKNSRKFRGVGLDKKTDRSWWFTLRFLVFTSDPHGTKQKQNAITTWNLEPSAGHNHKSLRFPWKYPGTLVKCVMASGDPSYRWPLNWTWTHTHIHIHTCTWTLLSGCQMDGSWGAKCKAIP